MLPPDIRYQYLYNEYEEKKIINNFIKHLELSVEKKFEIKSSGKLIGSKKQGYYMVYFRPTIGNECDKSIELTMRLRSPNLGELITSEEVNTDISDKDLNILAYNRAELVSVEIHGLYTKPKGEGLGGFVVKEVIQFLRQMKSIQIITLIPDGDVAKSFWTHMGFTEFNKELFNKYNELISFDTNHKMVYELY